MTLGGRPLLQFRNYCGARRQYDDAIRQIHGLVHVVRDEDRGELSLLPKLKDELLKVHASQRVDRAEGFIHQDDLRVGDSARAPSHALLHAAGKLPGKMPFKASQANKLKVMATLSHEFHAWDIERRCSIAKAVLPRPYATERVTGRTVKQAETPGGGVSYRASRNFDHARSRRV